MGLRLVVARDRIAIDINHIELHGSCNSFRELNGIDRLLHSIFGFDDDGSSTVGIRCGNGYLLSSGRRNNDLRAFLRQQLMRIVG